MVRAKIINIILESLKDLNEELQIAELDNPDEDTLLYGPKGSLQSIDLVSLVVDIEARIENEFGRTMVLADERAMSQRLSPFIQVKRLAGYIEKLLQEADDE